MNEVILAIIELLKAKFGTEYKQYYFGEIRVPAQMTFPFLEIIPLGSRIDNRGTGGMTDNEFRVGITIKTTLKNYLSTKAAERMVHIQDLVKRMEERNADGTIKDNTVLGVLHDNLQLEVNEVKYGNINGEWEINYDESDLGDSYILYATVTFTVKRIT